MLTDNKFSHLIGVTASRSLLFCSSNYWSWRWIQQIVLQCSQLECQARQPLIWPHQRKWFSPPPDWREASGPGVRNTISRATEIIHMSRPASPSSCVIITSTSGRRAPKSHQIFPTFSQVQLDVGRGWPTDQSFCSVGRLEVSRTELEKWIYFSLFTQNLSTAFTTYWNYSNFLQTHPAQLGDILEKNIWFAFSSLIFTKTDKQNPLFQ